MIFRKTKEALTNTGAHHHVDGGSLSDGGTSFTITVPSCVNSFKGNESLRERNYYESKRTTRRT